MFRQIRLSSGAHRYRVRRNRMPTKLFIFFRSTFRNDYREPSAKTLRVYDFANNSDCRTTKPKSNNMCTAPPAVRRARRSHACFAREISDRRDETTRLRGIARTTRWRRVGKSYRESFLNIQNRYREHRLSRAVLFL